MLTLFAVSAQLWAQNRTISGRVTDENGAAVSGASIIIKGTNLGTTSNAEGNYSLSVPANGRTLVISGVGLTTQEVSINSSGTVNVSMRSGNQNLDEVVVTGYTREKRRQYTGANTVVNAKVIETVPVGSFDQALQGQVPGLLINSGNGQPGANAGNIRIRGTGSLSGSTTPLFIMDGVPIPAGEFQTLNPNDFESVTVLKDASAGALYGARGGNGVVVITTKRGRAGQTNIQARAQIGFTQRPQPSQFFQMNSRQMLDYEEFVGGFVPGLVAPGWTYSKKNPTYATLPATSPASNPFAASQARYDFLRDSLANNNVDYYDLLFKTGITQSYNVTLSGGNQQTRYLLGLGNFNQEGTDRKSRLNRYTLRFNLDNTVGKFSANLSSTVGYSTTDYNEGAFYAGNGTANPFAMVWRAKPYEKPYGSPNGALIFGASTANVPKALGNLIERSDNSTWIDRQIKGNIGLTLSLRATSWLTLRNTTGIDASINNAQGWINANSYVGSLQTYQAGLLNESQFNRLQLVNTSSAIYNNRFGDRHELEVGAYFEAVRQWNQGSGFYIYNLDPRLAQTGQGAGTLVTNGAATIAQNGSSATSGYGIRSFFGTLRYTLDNKYTFTANARRDGTSRIVKEENKTINSYSAGFTWDAIRESFLQTQKIFSDLRLRVTYGQVPNIGGVPQGPSGGTTYGIQSLFYSVARYQALQIPAFSAVTQANSTITGIAPTAVNPDLRIESSEKLNVGVDMGFWNNRVRFSVDAYNNTSNDLFANLQLPATSGFYGTLLPLNAGTMNNKGLEFDLSVDVVKTRNMDLTIRGNHSINKNRITDLGAVSEYTAGTGIVRVGLPIGQHYSYAYLGADPATGRPIYKRQDGTPTTNINEAGQFAEFGSWLPVHQGGFSANFRYKQFTLAALFSYQADVRRYNNIQNWVSQGDATYTGAVTQSQVLLTDQWQKPGDVKMLQSPAYSRQFTSYDITDASFLRFRNLELGYNIPALKIGGSNVVKSARFYVQGQNLWVWSRWSGLDPEDDNNISLAEFPNPRAVVVGLDINF